MSLNLDRSGWERVRLGTLATASKEKVDPSDGSVSRHIAGEHMDSDDLKIHRWGDPREVDLGPAFHRRFHAGQILYGSRRTYLRKVAVADFDGVCANTTFVVETRDSAVLLQEFLPFVMSSEPFHAFAIAESKGSVNPYVNWSDIERYEFDLPPLDEQKRIADLLWAIEDERRAVSDALEAARRARSAFRDELFASLSAPGQAFESICSIPSQNGVTLRKSERSGPVPMVNMGEMFKGEAIAIDSEYERVLDPKSSFHLAEGDLLFARRSVVFEGAGACCIVPKLDETFTFESSVIRSRVTRDVDPRFVLHYFRSNRGRQAMSKIVRRGPVSGVSGTDLRKLQVPVPELDDQLKIVELIERIDGVTPELERRYESARVLAASVLVGTVGGN